MSNLTKQALLSRAARRLVGDRRYMVSALVLWSGEEWNEERFGELLECSPSDAVKIALCTRPSGSSLAFRTNVARIAAIAGIPPGRIANAIRQAEAVEEFTTGTGVQLLAAARDRIEHSDSDDSEEG